MKKTKSTLFKKIGLLIGFLSSPLFLLAQVNLNNGLVANYLFDNTLTDASGNNNHGALTGGAVNYIANRFATPQSAIAFGGPNNWGKVTVNNSSSLTFNNEASFAFWMKIISNIGTNGSGNTVAGGSQSAFAKYGDAGGGLYQLCSVNGTTLNQGFGNVGMSFLSQNLSPYNLDQWVHCVITMDANGHKIYMNGNLLTSNNTPADFSVMNTKPLVFGAFASNWYPYNGAIDDFRVYNRALNGNEISALANDAIINISLSYNGATQLCAGDSLLISYTTSGTFSSGNQFTLQMSDGSGSFDHPIPIAKNTLPNSTFNTIVPSGTPSGNLYRFRILSSAPAAFSDSSQFVQVKGVIGDIPNSADFRYVGNVNGRNYYIGINGKNMSNAKLSCQNNGGYLASVPNQGVNDLFQSNITGSRAYIGLNDVQTEGLYMWENDDPLTFKNWYTPQPDNNGNEDYTEMRKSDGKWNDLSGATVQEYFMELHPAGIDKSLCAESDISLNAATLNNAAYLWTGPDNFSSSQQNIIITSASLLHSGIYTLTYTLNGCSAQSQSRVNIKPLPINTNQNSDLLPSLSNGLILYYPMDGDANDASGNGNDGIISGGVSPAKNRFGEDNKALDFNGTNGYISAPSGVYFNEGNFTVNAWINKKSNKTWSRLFDFGNGPANSNVLLALTNGTSGKPTGEIYNGTSSPGQATSPSATILNNQWAMLTFTLQGTAGRIYINGNLVAQDVLTHPDSIIRTLNYIGRSNWAVDGYADATFDDFRLYNRVLNTKEIESLLQEQPQNLNFITIPGTTVCTGSAAQIGIINAQPGVSYQMYNANTMANIGNAITANGDTLWFSTGNLNAATLIGFNATSTYTGCSRAISPNLYISTHDLPTTPTVSGGQICNGGQITLTATGAVSGEHYNWYDVPSGGVPIPGQTGPDFIVNTNVTQNYYVSITGNDGCEGTRTLVTATVLNPLNPPVDIISGLIVHYKLDGNYDDFSGNNYNASPNGNIVFVNDRHGQAQSAINTTNPANNSTYLNMGNPLKIQQLNNQMTVSVWIRQTQTWFDDNGTMPIINKWDNGSSTGWWLGLEMNNPNNMTNKIKWRVSGATYTISTANVATQAWQHIVGTYNGSQLKVYLNGNVVGTANYTGSIQNTGLNAFIGRYASGTPSDGINFRGDLDEIKIYNRALNSSEISTLYNNESVAFANTPFCSGNDDLTLTTFNFPGATYQWTGPHGYTSILQSPTVISAADSATYAGVYTLVVTSSDGCVSPPQTVNAVIYEIPGAPQVINDTICGSGNATLTASGAVGSDSYVWYTVATGGTPIAGQNGATLIINNITTSQTRYVALIRNGCEGARVPVQAIYNAGPITSLTVIGSSVCSGISSTNITISNSELGVSYQAFYNSNPVSSLFSGNGGNLTVAINTTSLNYGNNTITIQAIQPGCGAVNLTNTATVTLNQIPNVNAGLDLAVCVGASVTLTATGANNYTWNNGITNGVSFIPNTTLTYTVTGTSLNGCSNTDSVTVTVDNPPLVNAGADVTVCLNDGVTLQASGADTYNWDNGISNGQIFYPTSTQTYTVTGNQGACSATDELTVTVNPLPTVIAGTDTTICEGASILLTASGAITYTWDNGVTDGISFTPANTQTYTVIGTDVNGCENTDAVIVTVTTCTSLFDVENELALYPNPVKEHLTIKYPGFYEFEIRDILGNVVLQSTGVNQSIISTQSFSEGVYFITFKQIGQASKTVKLIKVK